jgi:hypothetical protein
MTPKTERSIRVNEVGRALRYMCDECVKAKYPAQPSPRGGLGHRIFHGRRPYWIRCGRDNAIGRYLLARLADLKATVEETE